MRVVTLSAEDDFAGWRDAARSLALAGIPPEQVAWTVGGGASDLFGAAGQIPAQPSPAANAGFSVPKAFLPLAELASRHADPERWALLYTALHRLRAQPKLLDDAADPLVRRLQLMAKEVRKEAHKMHAYVRFREVETNGQVRYVAWFEPGHHIVRAEAGFFARRFANMAWSILTPELCAHHDEGEVTFTAGATKADAPDGDPVEEVWRTYYQSTFNPARLKVRAMTKEMPKRYWHNLPEASVIAPMIQGAQRREAEMVERSRTAIPEEGRDLELALAGEERAREAERRIQPGGNALAAWEALLAEAKACTRCHLYGPATQTVFGEGPLDARIVFVGEQPGDQEDIAGRPFVGPAGQMFNQALAEAGVDRSQTYVTNAVKHFKYEQRGKRRIHSKPETQEIEACRWWVGQEIEIVRPPVTVALGATAARSLFGKAVTITATRGRAHALPHGGETWVTVHPSFLLRIPEPDRKEREYGMFVDDLRRIRDRVEALAA